jgi:hypothetical protein
LENGLRNIIWPREGLQLAKILKSPCSSNTCRRVIIRHDLLSPNSIWK